jgi:enoyl-CoA hydratase/carnithine racemase
VTHTPHGQISLDEEAPGYYRAVFAHPPINLAEPEFFDDLRSVITTVEQDDGARVLVFESSTPDYFVAHYDVVKGVDMEHPPGPTGLPLWPDITTRMAQAPFTTIAKLRGRARGVGAEFVLACDMRFASLEKAVIGQPEVGLGLFPGGGGTERLPALVGRARALEIVLGCEDFDAATAERYGWVNRALPDADLDAFVDRLARRIASFDRPALAKAKSLINHSSPMPERSDLVAAQDAFFGCLGWERTRARVGWLLEHGLQTGSDTELRLGEVLGELGDKIDKLDKITAPA